VIETDRFADEPLQIDVVPDKTEFEDPLFTVAMTAILEAEGHPLATASA
jgi:hypothetical protein